MGIDDYFNKLYDSKTYTQYPILTQTVAPTTTICGLTATKNYIKVNHTNDDTLINTIIKSVESTIENQVIFRCLNEQSYKQQQQGGCNTIKLLKCPVKGTPTVTIYEEYDSTGENFTDFYMVDNILYPYDGYFSKYRNGDGITINYDCKAYTNSVIENVIYRMVAFLYENRQLYCTSYGQENWSINYDLINLPSEFRTMLAPYRQGNLGVL